MSDNMRVMRVVLPVEQIRRMDRLLLQGAGGFENRNEFIKEAIETQILDLSFPAVDDAATQALEFLESPVARVSLELRSTDWGHVMPPLTGRSHNPLFGLHNRDYPTLWSLWRLSCITQDEPVALNLAVRVLLDEAWDAGRQLQSIKADEGAAITSIFPTNPVKRDAAENAFKEFALGSATLEEGSIRTTGPLFEWGLCSVSSDSGQLLVGLTEEGWTLLARLDGLKPIQPHKPEHARAFTAHLRDHAPADWECFHLVLEACDLANPSRGDLVDAFTTSLGLSSENVASTYASGYVARCREWGLLEAKQVKGTYVITDLGRSIRREADNGNR